VLVEEELARFTPQRDTVLTIGVFDGVHLGHKHLISMLREQAARQSMLSGVVTFRHNPEKLLSHRNKLPFLTEIEERVELLKNEGVNIVVPLSFTPELAQLDAGHFVELLQKHLRMRGLVIGPDFALGKDREGNIEYLEKLGRERNFSVVVVPPLMVNGKTVSSTSIRKTLAEGDLTKFNELTGRTFHLHGKVVSGAGRGEGLGFPTANLDVSSQQAIPKDGVYASMTHINGQVYRSVTNIGTNPTFGRNERTIESFLLDYHGDLYGHEISLDFVTKLRDEKKFHSAEELQNQVAEDIKHGMEILKSKGAS
jgi:riboflavin kinase/FMN adenylyltransferase